MSAGHSITDVGIRCPQCGLIYAKDEPHVCPTDIGPPREGTAAAPRPRAAEGPDLSGTVLGERYQIIKRLSAGGMGVVYQARHIVLGNLLAVKILLRAQDEEARARFLREAQLASQIQHPNIVFISDFGVLADGQPYLVMEFLQGPTLRQLLSPGPLDPLRACQLGVQITRGLLTVHEKGIIHRDLKPENIFVLEQEGKRDFVKIVDFGLARSENPSPLPSAPASPLTLPGTVLGTPAYMAPEQVRGEAVDARADQYALGCILFEMLTGREVYSANNLMKLLSQHLNEPIPSLSERAPQRQFAPGLEALVRRALAKQPAERFGSLRELEQALQEQIDALLAQRGLSRSPTGVRTPMSRRLPWLLLPLGIALLGSGYLGYRYDRLRSSRPAATTPSTRYVPALRQRALLTLQADLRAADLLLRRQALVALSQTRDVALVEPLKQALRDPNTEVQAQAAEALGQLGSGQPRPKLFTIAEQSPVPLVRVAAAGALDQLEDSRGRPLLRQFLRDKDAEVRVRAAHWLCSPGEREAQGIITTTLERGKLREEVVVSLWYRLAQSGDKKALPPLLGRLHTDSGSSGRGLQIVVATDLVRLGEEQGRLFLHAQLRRPGIEQIQAARALAELDEPGHAELFRQIVRQAQGSLETRIEAVRGLSASGNLEDMLLLESFLAETTAAALRQAAAVALVQISERDPEIIAQRSFEWARGAVADDRWFIREAAAAALGEIDIAQAVPMIGELLARDKEVRVRRRAARALGRRVEDEVLLALCKSLHDEDSEVRLESLRSLDRVGQILLRRGEKGVLGRVSECESDLLKNGSPEEQILARASLLRLGDGSQRESLLRFEQSSATAIRKLLIEQLEGDVAFLARALGDTVLSVRFAAAGRLAELGDRQALPVLHSVLKQGGSEGIAAYGLLHQLGVDAPSPADLEALLGSPAVAERLATVEAIGRMPTALAVPLLTLAARDPEKLVRRLVAEVAADLKDDSPDHSGKPVLRLLAADRDLSVRTRATALLSRLMRPPKEERPTVRSLVRPQSPPAATTTPTAPIPSSPPADPVLPNPLPVAAPPDGAASESALPTSSSEELDPTVEQLRRQGLSALAKKDVRQAQRLFDRAQTMCKRNQRKLSVCDSLGTDFSYQLARVFESQKEWAEAMVEYQKIAHASGPRRAKPEQRAAALEAIIRLSPRLGRILITKLVRGKCQQSEMWMPPGNQMVNIGGQLRPVKLSAQQTATFEQCQLSHKKGTH